MRPQTVTHLLALAFILAPTLARAQPDPTLQGTFLVKSDGTAFIYKDGVVVEYLQYYDLDNWFGQPNPPGFEHVPF